LQRCAPRAVAALPPPKIFPGLSTLSAQVDTALAGHPHVEWSEKQELRTHAKRMEIITGTSALLGPCLGEPADSWHTGANLERF
jgi:hypothetical protein